MGHMESAQVREIRGWPLLSWCSLCTQWLSFCLCTPQTRLRPRPRNALKLVNRIASIVEPNLDDGRLATGAGDLLRMQLVIEAPFGGELFERGAIGDAHFRAQ